MPDKQDDTCYKAISLIKENFKISKGIKIKVIKSIPAGAGLGGGSSNGATVLKILNNIWKLGLSQTQLEKIASKIGVDLPFFISGGMKIMRGKGDIVEEKIIVKSPFFGVLVVPSIHISSSFAYKVFDEYNRLNLQTNKLKQTIYKLKNAILKGDMVKFVESIRNDFEDCILNYYPALNEIKNLMIQCGCLNANISGSGSSLWGICLNEVEAELVVRKLKKKLPLSCITKKIMFPAFC